MRRIWLIACLLLGCFLLSSTPVSADSDWRINRFHSDISVQPDGKAKITETIEADFGSVAKHGIFRDIPYQYQSGNDTLYTSVDVWGVERDGVKEPYETDLISGYTRLKIGDADAAITGKHTYVVTYFASGVLRGFEGYDELYWNVTGNGWDVPIDQASATVTLPRQGIIKLACYQGETGSTEECPSITISPLEARFSATHSLPAASGLTVAVGYTKGVVPLITVEKPKTTTDLIIESASQPISWLGVVASLGAGLAVPLLLWWKKGRDFWWAQPGSLVSSQLARLKPLGGKPQVIAEFTPPEGLRPGQLGLVLDQHVTTLDITSTIIDLASRGFLTIKELPKSWAFGSQDYQLHQISQSAELLLPYEKLLLDRLFASGQSINLSHLKNTFYDDLRDIQQKVYDSISSKNYFTAQPDRARNRYLLLGIATLLFGGILMWLALSQSIIWLAIVALAPVIAGAGTMLFSRAMPQRTALGFDVYRRALGYKEFIATAEKYRQQFFEKENLFNEVLPYAMVLGLTHKFAEAMKQIGYVPSQPAWYTGRSAFNVAAFSTSMSTMSKAMGSAMASAPSSSGSGGGGSSGGGFGGGGGGSW